MTRPQLAGGGNGGTGVDAWLPEPMLSGANIEYRLQVKARSTSTVMDPNNADAAHRERAGRRSRSELRRPDRDAIRMLARLEVPKGRDAAPSPEVRGEDASDLLPLLKARRVIAEPQMMELLRFGDEPLRPLAPSISAELSHDGSQVVVRLGAPCARAIRESSRCRRAPGFFGSPGGSSIRKRGGRGRSTGARRRRACVA